MAVPRIPSLANTATPTLSVLALVSLLLLLSLLAAQCSQKPPPPEPGVIEYQSQATAFVPGGQVNLAGGNLHVRRVELSIDTRLGTHEIAAVYNSSASDAAAWHWSFELRYDGATFLDPSGRVHDVSALADGAPVPGSVWVRRSATEIATRGGLVYGFDPAQGSLLSMRRVSAAHPRLEFVQEPDPFGGSRAHRVEQCTTSGCTLVYAIEYDDSGARRRVVSITDRAGRVAGFEWDAFERLVAARDALDAARGWPGFRYEYDGELLRAATGSEDERVEYAYTPASPGPVNRLTRVTSIGGSNPEHAFGYFGPSLQGIHRTAHTDPLGETTEVRYDGERRVTSVTKPTGDTTALAWTGLRPSQRTDPGGTVTSWAHQDDRLASTTLPWGQVVTFHYAPHGENREHPERSPLVVAQDALGVLEQRSYDAQGRLESITNGAGETTSFGYGPDEEVASRTEPNGVVTTFSGHGEHGHPTRVLRAGAETELVYDAVGNLLEGAGLEGEAAPGLGGVVRRAFDADRNVALLELANHAAVGPTSSELLAIEHRSDGQRTRMLRPAGADTEFVYDALGRLVERRERADGVWASTWFARDELGRIVSTERANGMREEWDYDAAGRIAARRILRHGALEESASLTWDAGRLVSIRDSSYPGDEGFVYDGAGRLVETVFPGGERIELGYDARSRVDHALLRNPDGSVLRQLGFLHDGADRETQVLDGGVPRIDRVWTAGAVASTRYGNGLTRSFSYDPASGELIGAITTDLAGAVVESTVVDPFDTACAFAAQCISATTDTSGALVSSSFERYWLMPERGPLPLSRAGLRVGAYGSGIALQYDHTSNLTQSAHGLHVYNAERNRLQRIEAGGAPVHTYAYDAAGFATERSGTALAWDGAGRVAAIGSNTFAWDTQGRAVARSIGGVEVRMRFGGLVQADAAGNPVGLDLGEVRLDLIAGNHLYRHFDFRGNPKLVADQQGDVVALFQYGPYGLEVALGAAVDAAGFARGRDLGDLVLIGARPYDPAAARFLAPDPIHQLVNQYAYTLGNPVELWDPSGLASAGVNFAAGAAAIAGAALGAALGASVGGPAGIALGIALGNVYGQAVGLFVYQALTRERGGTFQLVPAFGTSGAGSSSSPGGTVLSGPPVPGFGVEGPLVGCSPVESTTLPAPVALRLLAVLVPVNAVLALAAWRARRSKEER